MAAFGKPILKISDLVVEFRTDRGIARAVNQVSFELREGEILGIVGESGCGKSVTSLALLGLIDRTHGRVASGSIEFDGRDLTKISEREYRGIRGSSISMIFQDPMTALNPIYTIGDQMVAVIRRHQKNKSLKEAKIRAEELLTIVGIPSPRQRLDEYPHQLSGGMRQRVMIAIALLCSPKILIADEPTTALDVTTQAQVLEEITRLQKTYGMSVILVTHDMGVVAETCDRVAVMYCGKIVETASVKDIFQNPRHPYTRGLLESIPVVREKKLDRLPVIEGMVPDILALPEGCSFADRCPRRVGMCTEKIPYLAWSPTPVNQRGVACFNPEPEKI